VHYAVVVENAGGNFSAYVPDIPGCVAAGQTVAEAEAALREAIDFHLEGMGEDGAPTPPPSSHVDYMEVAAELVVAADRDR
jgi:predicted RNase H-like HicB family nuclease